MCINSRVLGIVLCDITQALLCLASFPEPIGRLTYTAAGIESPSVVQYGNSVWLEQALLIHPSFGGHLSCKPFADYEEPSRRLAAAAPEVLISAPLCAYLHWKCSIKGLSSFPTMSPHSYRLYKKALNTTYQRRHLLSSFYIFSELISFYLCIW